VFGIGLMVGVCVLSPEIGVALVVLLVGVCVTTLGVRVTDAPANGSGVAVEGISCATAITVRAGDVGTAPDCARPVCLSSSTVSRSTKTVKVLSQPAIHRDRGNRLRSSWLLGLVNSVPLAMEGRVGSGVVSLRGLATCCPGVACKPRGTASENSFSSCFASRSSLSASTGGIVDIEGANSS
jgi:hypothetical protein